jgi:hypothetical protein
MYETLFMCKPLSYWHDLEDKFGDVKDDPYMLLLAAEARLAKLDRVYDKDREELKNITENLRNQLGIVNGK